MVRLRGRDSYLELLHFESRPLRPGVVTDAGVSNPQFVTDQLLEIWSAAEIRTRQVAMCVRGSSIVTTQVMLPRYGHPEFDREVLRALERLPAHDARYYQADAWPLDVNDKRPGPIPSTLVAVPKGLLASYLSPIKAAQLQPLVADTAGGALSGAFEANYGYPESETVMLVHLGTITTVQVTARGIYEFAKDFSVDASGWGLTHEEALSALKHARELWRAEPTFTPVEKAFISGFVDQIEAVAHEATIEWSIPVAPLDTFSRVRTTPFSAAVTTQDSARAAVALGLALRFANEPGP